MGRGFNCVMLGAVLGLGLQGAAEAADFINPKIAGYRVDWCREWAANCGQPAADAFCQAMGFVGASGFVPAPDIGAATPTRVIGTGQICNEAFCDGFAKITCQSVAPATFTEPKMGGWRLDWCREWASNCGKPAADAFCQDKGYSQSIAFTPAPDIGASTPTVVITSGQVCSEAFCDGFASITCQ